MNLSHIDVCLYNKKYALSMHKEFRVKRICNRGNIPPRRADFVEKALVVAYQQQGPCKGTQLGFQGQAGRKVEMVGRLIENQEGELTLQSLCQQQLSQFTGAWEGRLEEQSGITAQTHHRRDNSSLCLGIERLKFLVGAKTFFLVQFLLKLPQAYGFLLKERYKVTNQGALSNTIRPAYAYPVGM